MDCTVFSSRVQSDCAALRFHAWQGPGNSAWAEFFRLPESGFLIRFPGLADFELAADGLLASAWPAQDVSQDTVQHLYRNQVEPLQRSLLRQTCFHASAVEVAGCVAAFMGASGQGKSTLATSMALQAGARLLTDDALHLRWQGDACVVEPSHASVRLRADSEHALLKDQPQEARSTLYNGKAYLAGNERLRFADAHLPLGCVFILGQGDCDTPVATRLSSGQAMAALMQNTFLLEVDSPAALAWQFEAVGRLAELPVFYQLDYPRRYDALPAVHRLVRQHADPTDINQ